MNSEGFFKIFQLQSLPEFSNKIKRPLYEESLKKFAFKLSDGAKFSQDGDTHFGFLVPIPAESGTALVKQMIAQGVVSDHFVLSVLLVDFTNPVYSSPRASLWKYVPATVQVKDGASNLTEQTAQAIADAAPCTPKNSAERQFMENWTKTRAQLLADAEKRIQEYQAALMPRLKTQEGVNDYTRLAESRRQRFAASALNEFPLLLPRTNLPDKLGLRMNLDGSVSP